MRKLVLAAAVAVMACGSSSSSSSSATGTIGGSPFSPAETAAFYVAPVTCSLPAVGDKALTAVGVAFNSTTGTCNDVVQCVTHRNSREVMVVIAKFPVIGSGQPVITTGDYAVGASMSTPQIGADGMGTVAFATATSTANDATCTPTVHTPSTAASSTIHLGEVSASRIAGTVDLTFDDGGTLSGSFSVTPCGSTPDVCTLAQAGGLCQGLPACQ